MAGLKIQRNDTVEVITGSEKDKGRQGRVLRVFPGEDKILVQGIRVIKKNVKPNPQKNIKGGVAEQEAKLADLKCNAGVPGLRSDPGGVPL